MNTPSGFPKALAISAFGYDLPDEKIATYPLAQREASKLLVWKKGQISESHYHAIENHLPASSLLVFNNSRVIEARILFTKETGGRIEIFCLEPHRSYLSMQEALMQQGKVWWICLIGGASKWKRGQILEKRIGDIYLRSTFIEKRKEDFIVEFSWEPSTYRFAEILHLLGSIPLPPYLKRNADQVDAERYQTVYAHETGSVAAPTAGLHFSESLIQKLSEKGIGQLFLTLHVGAGTFMPLKVEHIGEHFMHEEFIEVTADALKTLILKLDTPVIAVGTTSLRALETLYWLGLQVSQNKTVTTEKLHLDQWYPYQEHAQLNAKEALHHLLEWLNKTAEKKLLTKTQLFIVPGYQFKIVRGLITNFHQPNSTLLLLVAALVGTEWQSIYQYALEKDFRFLSYGDGCLLLPD